MYVSVADYNPTLYYGDNFVNNNLIACCLRAIFMLILYVLYNIKLSRTISNLHCRLNFNPCKISNIFYHSSKEHVKIRKMSKFGCEMLSSEENIAS